MTNELLKTLTPADIEEILDARDELCARTNVTPEGVLYILLEKNQSPPSIGVRFPSVLRAAEDAAGRKLSRERSKENTTLRAMIAYQLRSEGYTFYDIGRVLRRDHSTVMHLCAVMRDMLSVPAAYRVEMEIFKRFEAMLGQTRQ